MKKLFVFLLIFLIAFAFMDASIIQKDCEIRGMVELENNMELELFIMPSTECSCPIHIIGFMNIMNLDRDNYIIANYDFNTKFS